MGRRTFSGLEVVKVLVNVGGFEWHRTVGDHAQLYYEHPRNEDDRRQVTVPLHDELGTGTLWGAVPKMARDRPATNGMGWPRARTR